MRIVLIPGRNKDWISSAVRIISKLWRVRKSVILTHKHCVRQAFVSHSERVLKCVFSLGIMFDTDRA